jgi:hypothetical protein
MPTPSPAYFPELSHDRASTARRRPVPARLRTSVRCILALLLAAGVVACGGGGSATGAPVVSAPPVTGAPPEPALPALAATPIPLFLHASVGAAFWPEGSSATGGHGPAIDGIDCMPAQHIHEHAHVAILRDGVLLGVPANIGLQGCIYETHTHDMSGVIHLETATQRRVTLGQFFSVWGQTLTSTNVAGIAGLSLTVFINNGGTLTRYDGDPAAIELGPHREITLVLGAVPATIPSYSWSPDL